MIVGIGSHIGSPPTREHGERAGPAEQVMGAFGQDDNTTDAGADSCCGSLVVRDIGSGSVAFSARPIRKFCLTNHSTGPTLQASLRPLPPPEKIATLELRSALTCRLG
jgi:hypothetical protein